MIKKIIHTFLHNPMPEQVQQQFRTWCLNKERAGEKTDALWKEWERLDPASVLPADEKAYRRKLDRLHREMTRNGDCSASPAARPPLRPQSSCWRCPSNSSS